MFPLNLVNSVTKMFIITVKGLQPAISCVRDQDTSTAPARHMWETGPLNGPWFMLQWFIRFPNFAEFTEFSFHLEKIHYAWIKAAAQDNRCNLTMLFWPLNFHPFEVERPANWISWSRSGHRALVAWQHGESRPNPACPTSSPSLRDQYADGFLPNDLRFLLFLTSLQSKPQCFLFTHANFMVN